MCYECVMNEIQEKLKSNYINDVKEYLEFLKSKSYILTLNGEKYTVWCYNARLNDFYQKCTVTDLIRDIISHCHNWYDFVVTFDEYTDLIFEILPLVAVSDIDSFRKYNEAKKNLKNKKDLESDRKKLNKELSNHKRPVLLNAPDDVQEQIQALINNGVVFCRYSNGYSLKKNGLFIWNQKDGKYDICTTEYICNVLKSVFSSDFDPQRIRWRLKSYYQGLIESNLPYQWNRNKEYENIIKEYNNPVIDGTQWV